MGITDDFLDTGKTVAFQISQDERENSTAKAARHGRHALGTKVAEFYNEKKAFMKDMSEMTKTMSALMKKMSETMQWMQE